MRAGLASSAYEQKMMPHGASIAAVTGTCVSGMSIVWSGGVPGAALESASRSRRASASRSALADTHSAFWCPWSHVSRTMAACVRPLPTPAPSASRKPARYPAGESGSACVWPAKSTASSCTSESTPVFTMRRGMAGT